MQCGFGNVVVVEALVVGVLGFGVSRDSFKEIARFACASGERAGGEGHPFAGSLDALVGKDGGLSLKR